MALQPIAVTTRAKPAPADEADAAAVAARWNVPCLRRPSNGPLGLLFAQAETLLVVERSTVTLWDAEGSARWAAGLAALRLRSLEAGDRGEALLRVGGIARGERVLDCTLGLAQDARVAARLAGPGGRVLGLESCLPLAIFAAEGLRREPPDDGSALLEVRHADARTMLHSLSAGAFDVVLFDPMFSREGKAQPSFALLRRLANVDRLDAGTLAEARRVARRVVLVKAPRHGPDLRALGLRPERASRSAPVVWARLDGSTGGGA